VDSDTVTLTVDTTALEATISELRADVDSNTLELSWHCRGSLLPDPRGHHNPSAPGRWRHLAGGDEEAGLREALGVRVSTAEGTLAGDVADLDALRQDLDEEAGLREALGVGEHGRNEYLERWRISWRARFEGQRSGEPVHRNNKHSNFEQCYTGNGCWRHLLSSKHDELTAGPPLEHILSY